MQSVLPSGHPQSVIVLIEDVSGTLRDETCFMLCGAVAVLSRERGTHPKQKRICTILVRWRDRATSKVVTTKHLRGAVSATSRGGFLFQLVMAPREITALTFQFRVHPQSPLCIPVWRLLYCCCDPCDFFAVANRNPSLVAGTVAMCAPPKTGVQDITESACD